MLSPRRVIPGTGKEKNVDPKEMDMSLWCLFLPQASVHIETSTTNQENLSREAVTSASVTTLVSTASRECCYSLQVILIDFNYVKPCSWEFCHCE